MFNKSKVSEEEIVELLSAFVDFEEQFLQPSVNVIKFMNKRLLEEERYYLEHLVERANDLIEKMENK